MSLSEPASTLLPPAERVAGNTTFLPALYLPKCPKAGTGRSETIKRKTQTVILRNPFSFNLKLVSE